MEVHNSHLPSSSLRGWLLAIGEGRQKSTAKSCSVFKWHGIWMACLSADKGGVAYEIVPLAEDPDYAM